jgi:sarcosine oxidase subunit alpha
MSRLAAGGIIDRDMPLAFTFDGRRYTGFAGDTLASALVANGIRLVGRSFKYHRPRGILTAGGEEPNALVTLRSGARAEPNTRATVTPLHDGLEAVSQNRWPTLGFDLMAVNQLLAPFLGAGFYYKTLMWPSSFWEKIYEPLIRRAAGLGALSMLPDPDRYDREHGFCDLLVIGAGPAGLAAALHAGRAGLRVLLADEDRRPGGRLLSERHRIGDATGLDWADTAVAELAQLPNVRILPRTTIFGIYDGQTYSGIEHLGEEGRSPPGQPRQRLWKIVARQAILATGAIEQPMLFGGNDRPGIMMASAVSTYLNRYAAVPGTRAVVFTSTDSGWRTARDLLACGVDLAAVADTRAAAPEAARDVMRAGAEIFLDARVIQAYGAPLRWVEIAAEGRTQRIRADLLAMAGGWSPAIGLASNLGARPVWFDSLGCFLAGDTPPGLAVAGAAAGAFSLSTALDDGVAKARSAIEAAGRAMSVLPAWPASDDPSGGSYSFQAPQGRAKTFVDFQNDVTAHDIPLAAQEGFSSVEHLKRYTTLGMATDQGKTSNLNGHAMLAAVTGKSIAGAGTIMTRPPWQPVAIGALAGRHRGAHFRPERRTASHEWAESRGAEFVDTGQWKRARWFAKPGDRSWRDAVDREVTLTRSGVGICDVSTLGKIDLHGPDVGVLLDRLYINLFSTLPVRKARYGMMLREDGFAFDDGTTTRLAPDHYFLTTTTVNAARVMQHIDFARQVLWPELDVQATSVTEQWATYAVAGPKSRALVQALLPDLDLTNAAFPYMAATEARWNDGPIRVFRLSFSGELAYEVSVPALDGDRLIRRLFELGAPFGAIPYGNEALSVMRIEKGHPAGPELNGQTTAGDLGLLRMMSAKKDFIGRVLAARPGLADPARPTLVGLKPVDPRQTILGGAHLLAPGAPAIAANDEGYVTSAAWSPTLGHAIALGLLRHGLARHGERIVAHDALRGTVVEAVICNPVFVDPEGARVRG